MGLKVISSETVSGTMKVKYIYLTKDYFGRPQWQSAVLHLSSPLVESKHIGVMAYSDLLNVMTDWSPDADTELKIYHSKADDFVPFENSRELYRFFDSHGCSHVSIDSTSLTETHLSSGTQFTAVLMTELEAL